MLKTAHISLLKLKLHVPFTTSFGTQVYLKHPLIKLETTSGLVGYGEVPTLPDPAYKPESDTPSVLTSLKEFLFPAMIKYQQDFGPIETIAQLKNSYSTIKGANFAKSGIEAAFWDLLAQQQKQPLWKLWKGKNLDFPVGVSVGGKNIDDVLARVDQAVNSGYQRVKIKIWPGFDIEPVAKIRSKYPHLQLQVDANSSFNMNNWQTLKKLDKYKLLLIEQPLFDDDIVFHSEISTQLQTPICLDESIHSLADTQRAVLLWQKNANLKNLIINIKPPRVSGFSEAIAIANYCQTLGVKTWIGGMLDSPLGKACNLQLNTLSAISLPGDHFSPTGDYFEQQFTKPTLTTQNGIYSVSKKSISHGLKIDHQILKKISQPKFSFTFFNP